MKERIIGSVVAVFFLWAASTVHAQQPPTVDDMVAQMQAALNLSQAQVDAIKPIIAANRAQHEKIWHSEPHTMASIHKQLMLLKKDENRQFRKILTKDQMKQWKIILKQKHIVQAGRARFNVKSL